MKEISKGESTGRGNSSFLRWKIKKMLSLSKNEITEMNLEEEIRCSLKSDVPKDMSSLYLIISWKYKMKFRGRVRPRDMFEDQQHS